MAFSERTVDDDRESEPRFAVPGGPLDLLMADVFSQLDGSLIKRVETGFIIEFISVCRDNGNESASWAITETHRNLGLDTTSPNWGIREIDTERLLNGTCEEFVLYVQENGIGVRFYNDPVRTTLDAYWNKFVLDETDFEKVNGVEADAQFSCSLEPDKRFIDVLDAAASEYQLFRAH
ncbi:MAG: hypothetical protein AAFN43_12280 [Pseudomonadota bacterium]